VVKISTSGQIKIYRIGNTSYLTTKKTFTGGTGSITGGKGLFTCSWRIFTRAQPLL